MIVICYDYGQSKQNKEFTMKKALLLSVVASTMIMAGGDIEAVEVVEVSNWEWSGTAKHITKQWTTKTLHLKMD
jgi:hypothetical protein